MDRVFQSRRRLIPGSLALGLLLVCGALAVSPPATARGFHGGVHVGIGVGGWGCCGPYWGWPYYWDWPDAYGPYPGYAYPSAPAVVAQPPAQPGAAAPPMWYYCDNPKGYYPYVPSCKSQWRPVPMTPPPAGAP